MTYLEWNDIIGERFFNTHNEGQSVFLCVDDTLIEQLGGLNGKSDFISAIKCGPEGARRPNLSVCSQAKRTWEHQSQFTTAYPPYIAYLAFFVLAATQEGERETGYYKRFHRLLGEEETNSPPQNHREMWALWTDLEDWANTRQEGRFGIIKCDFARYCPHVGLPRAQMILTEHERKKLPQFFALVGFDPLAPPATEELAEQAKKIGSRFFDTRTIRRLGRIGPVKEEVRSLTIEAILDELSSWDGRSENEDGTSAGFHSIRLNLLIRDSLSGLADSRLVVRDSSHFPDEDFVVSSPDSASQSITIANFNGTWRSVNCQPVAENKAFSLFREKGLRLKFNSTVFQHAKGEVRILIKGEFDDIGGLIEVNRLDPHREFYVIASESAVDSIDEWGQKACENWDEIRLRSGLPEGYRLFRSERADPKIQPPSIYPALRMDNQIRIFLREGVKLNPFGKRYFDFAPPRIEFEGLSSNHVVRINDTEYARNESSSIILPEENLQPENRVSVYDRDEEIRSSTFNIIGTDGLSWETNQRVGTLSSGSIQDTSDGCLIATGAFVEQFSAPSFIAPPERSSDLIGATVGNILTIPRDPIPTDWAPIWLIEHGRSNRRVFFCGDDPEHSTPTGNTSNNRKANRAWKEILWNRRKQLAGPTKKPLASLWSKYKEIAKNA